MLAARRDNPLWGTSIVCEKQGGVIGQRTVAVTLVSVAAEENINWRGVIAYYCLSKVGEVPILMSLLIILQSEGNRQSPRIGRPVQRGLQSLRVCAAKYEASCHRDRPKTLKNKSRLSLGGRGRH